jgi:hypothetical protein
MRTYQLKETFYNKGLFELPDSNFNSFELFQYKGLEHQFNDYLECDNHDFTTRNKDYERFISIRKDGIYFNEFKLDSFFYIFKDIPFKIFMTFNLKGEYSLKNSFNKRVEFVESLIEKARKLCGNINFNDIVPVFTEESVNGKYHIHILLFIKNHVKINLRKLVEVLYYSLDRKIVYIPHTERRRKKLIQIIDAPLKVIAYISKLKNRKSSKKFYFRNKNNERYRKCGSFQSFRKYYLQHQFQKEVPEETFKPYTDLVKLFAA